MNLNVLIDNIVRQTTVLIAQLATAAGDRAPLAHIANQVFFELVKELKSQGLGNKVIADMFGLTLQTYRERVRRASESKTDRGTSLWEAVLGYVRARGIVSRAELLRRFRADDEATVRAVLNDLVEGGFLFRTGRVGTTTYRAATAEEIETIASKNHASSTANLVWVWLHQHGPASPTEIADALSLTSEALDGALDELTASERVQRTSTGHFQSDECWIPYGDAIGWEAAVFDHFQSVVTTIGTKVTQGVGQSHLIRRVER